MHRRIRLFLAQGGKLTRSSFVSQDGCRCAVSACVPPELSPTSNVNMTCDWYQGFISAFGRDIISWGDLCEIICGFDNEPTDGPTAYYQLGARLADEYL